MMAQKNDYIEYDKREHYKEQVEYLNKFNLTSHNINRFEDKVEAIVTSIDTEIRSSNSYIDDLQGAINNLTSKPEMKGSFDDPWYKVYKQQLNLIKYMIRASAFKTWLIKFLLISNNKFSEFLNELNEGLVELKTVEMRAEMFDKMYEDLKKLESEELKQFAIRQSENNRVSIEELKQMMTTGDGDLDFAISRMRAQLQEIESNIQSLKTIIETKPDQPDLKPELPKPPAPSPKPAPDDRDILEIDGDNPQEYDDDDDDEDEEPDEDNNVIDTGKEIQKLTKNKGNKYRTVDDKIMFLQQLSRNFPDKKFTRKSLMLFFNVSSNDTVQNWLDQLDDEFKGNFE